VETIMKKLVLSTLLVGLTLPAMGCIIVDDDDDPTPPSGRPELGNYDTVLRTSWNLLSGDQAASCKPGSNAAATLYSCPGTEASCTNPATQAFVDIGDCAVGQRTGVVDIPYANDPNLALPPGQYTVWYEFSADNRVWAKSFTKTIDLQEGRDEELEYNVQVDHGFIDAAWTLVRGGATVSCNGVTGLDGIGMNVGLCDDPACQDAFGEPLTFEYDCGPGEARSGPVPFNDAFPYSTVLEAFDASNGGLGTSDPPSITQPFTYGNEADDLGTIMIRVD
jgi:hypothetical protein